MLRVFLVPMMLMFAPMALSLQGEEFDAHIAIELLAQSTELRREARPGECYPESPFSKKYIKQIDKTLYKRRVFTCEYMCVNTDGSLSKVKGTSDIRDWLGESGRSFVCDGYRKTMKFVDTPTNPKSWGYWDIDGVSPFNPMGRKIPELKQWYRLNINLDRMELYDFHQYMGFEDIK